MSQTQYDEPIVVRITQPGTRWQIGAEMGFETLADAIRIIGSASFFTVVRTQDGDPIPPLTPEDMTEAERKALERARAARLIRGGEFDRVVPGPGEVIVGGSDGPVKVPYMPGGSAPSLNAVEVNPASTHTTTGAVKTVSGLRAEAWRIEGAGANLLDDPLFTDTPLWGAVNSTFVSPSLGTATMTVTSAGSTASVIRRSFLDRPVPASATVTVSVLVTAPVGRSVRLQAHSRTSTGGSGTLLVNQTVVGTGAPQRISGTGTYPETNTNGQVSMALASLSAGQQSGDVITWQEPQIEIGAARSGFIPQLTSGGEIQPGYTNDGATPTGPYRRAAATLTVPVAPQTALYARYSADDGATWQEGVVVDGKIGSVGVVATGDNEMTVTPTGSAFLLEGLIGIDRPFRAVEIAALEAGTLTLATLLSADDGSAPAPAQVTRAFHPAALTFRPVTGLGESDFVYHLSRNGRIIYLRNLLALKQSRDNLETTQTILTATGTIGGVRELDDGELLYSTNRNDATPTRSRIYKTTGYDPIAGTVTGSTMVLEADSQFGNFSNHWGLDVCGAVCVASQYGLKGEDGARYAYLSEDYGATWRMIFDQKETTKTIPGAPAWSATTAHMHTIHYDRYQDRIWIAVGDNPTTAVYYSDDRGATWGMVPDSTGPNAVQYTGIVSFPDGVVFGSDRAVNGVYAWRRSTGSAPVQINLMLPINSHPTLTHIFHQPFRRYERDGEMALFAGTLNSAYFGQYTPVIVGMTGIDNMTVLAELPTDQTGPSTVVGPTQDGYVFASYGGATHRAVAPFVSEM